jgi:ubiquinone/menaquinone biosynthesis C-methylase UbiE
MQVFEDARYNKIGKGYNLTRQADPHISDRLYELLSPRKGEFYLDIGCGTGNYTIELNRRGLKFYGVDPSDKMLEEAKFRSQKIFWLNGSAESIAVENNYFGGAIATLTMHHWDNLTMAFSEISRVLKSGARLIVFTALPDQMENYWLCYYFPGMMKRSIQQMPSFGTIVNALRDTGIKVTGCEKYIVGPMLKDFFLYAGKERPDAYLDDALRNSISSFTQLAQLEELKDGLRQLALDLVNGDIKKVRKKFDDSEGDYIFLILEKL